MFRVLRRLGLAPNQPDPPKGSLRARLRQRLPRLGAERVAYLAAFAGLLARVAYADSEISTSESKAIAKLLRERTELTAEESRLIAEIAAGETEALSGIENHLLNRAFNAHANDAEKDALIDCLYAVADADHLVSDIEDREIRRIAQALLVPHKRIIEIRSRYRDDLEILKLARHQ